MKLLDLFCGAGGCSMGYHHAGFDVTGVDIAPQPHYPFRFIQGDALDYVRKHGVEYDVIHASPPCQAYTRLRNTGRVGEKPDLIAIVREKLLFTQRPYVMENVQGAPLKDAFMLCGASFGLGVSGFDLNRHRFFESTFFILSPQCIHRRGQTIGVYGNGTNAYHLRKMGRCIRTDEMREALGIDWMCRKELSQAIPPTYTEWIGREIMKQIGR